MSPVHAVNLWADMISNPWFQNIGANIATILIVSLVGWMTYFFTRRRCLLQFFGIERQKKLVLYLSNVQVQRGGSSGVDGQPRSYAGPAIPANESMLVPVFHRLFNFVIPGLSEQSGLLKWLLISDVTEDAVTSPGSPEQVERRATFVAVGSPAYNSASMRIEEALTPLARFNSDGEGFSLDKAHITTDPSCGFVQRSIDQTSGQIAFYVAGISALGTSGAAYFLATRWLWLSQKYAPNKPFCIVLRFSQHDFRAHEILFEKG